MGGRWLSSDNGVLTYECPLWVMSRHDQRRHQRPLGSHVSLLCYVQFPVQSEKFLVSILREFEVNALNLFSNVRAGSPSPAASGKISLYFPANQGNATSETGSPMTASTATSGISDAHPRAPTLSNAVMPHSLSRNRWRRRGSLETDYPVPAKLEG
jgi:hypothetical protein